MKKLIPFLMLLLFACSETVIENPSPQFVNNSFDQGTIHPWVQIGTGESWMYMGGLSNDVIARGRSHSKILMQSGFPAGNYTIEVSVRNDNPIENSYADNGYMGFYSVDTVNDEIVELVLMPIKSGNGFNTVTLSFELTEETDIGFNGFRVGPGDGLYMTVSEIRIVEYTY